LNPHHRGEPVAAAGTQRVLAPVQHTGRAAVLRCAALPHPLAGEQQLAAAVISEVSTTGGRNHARHARRIYPRKH
jgi:hypothetical protein